MSPGTQLFRPVGRPELELIEAVKFLRFPPRLPHQPIFYPVLTYAYAEAIARDWNTRDAASGFAGFVTTFRVRTTFLERYTVQTVGTSVHQEYWIPAADLADFNDNLVTPIIVVAAFEGHQEGTTSGQ